MFDGRVVTLGVLDTVAVLIVSLSVGCVVRFVFAVLVSVVAEDASEEDRCVAGFEEGRSCDNGGKEVVEKAATASAISCSTSECGGKVIDWSQYTEVEVAGMSGLVSGK